MRRACAALALALALAVGSTVATVSVATAWARTDRSPDDVARSSERTALSKSTTGSDVDSSTLLLRWHDRPDDAAAQLARAGASNERQIAGTGWSVVDVEQGRSAEVRRNLESDPTVASVDVNRIRRAFAAPNDPYYLDQRAYLSSIRIEKAWEQLGNGSGEKIAVIDTGVDLDHPDLTARLIAGRDIVSNDSTPQDNNGHGTIVAGIAAATKNNNRGVAGVASSASIMPVKVLDGSGNGNDADIAAGITWAVDHGADVINLSLGGPGSTGVLANAISYAVSNDAIVVSAAGNDGIFLESFPAAYPGVIAVGATGDGNSAAYFTTRGRWVDVAAPGVAIVSTTLGTTESYGQGSGTSFASPIVAGVAALIHRAHPAYDSAQMANVLRSSAHDVGTDGFDPVFGAGKVNAFASALGVDIAGAPSYNIGAAEPDDTPADAAAQAGSSWLASIAPEGDEDWFAVDLSPGNKRARVTPPGPASGVDPRGLDAIVEVYEPGGDLIAGVDETGIDEQEVAAFDASGAGTYLIHVSNYASARSPGSYLVEVLNSGSPSAVTARPPWILDTSPASRVKSVSSGVSPIVDFGPDIDQTTISAGTVKLVNAAGQSVTMTRQYNVPSSTVTLNPSAALAKGGYSIRLAGVEDIGAGALGETWIPFTVGAAPETTAPNTTITAGPSGTIDDATATFKVGVNEPADTYCHVDSGAWSRCDNGTTRTVAPGTHTLEAFSIDVPEGNVETTPARRTWTYAPLGYWMLGSTGIVYPFGDVLGYGNGSGSGFVDLEPSPLGAGYWLLDSAGRVSARGDAPALGNASLAFGETATSLSRTDTGDGYWVFTSLGRVVARGDAAFHGDMSGVALNGPVLDSVATPSGDGYYMVASDGGVFAFGDAQFYGSMGGQPLNAPVQSLVPDGDGVGYWLVALDGGVFAFDAGFRGSMGGIALNAPITGMVRFGNGYLMVATDGGIFNFSDKPFFGSLGGVPIPAPIVSVAATG